MANADELTHVGMEIVTEGTKLSGMVLLKILESITKLFEREKDNRDFIINDNTKEGKQKIKDLVKKHNEGVMSFDDNLTKEQLNDYQKEFKKLGVDFSVIKNEKDNYSLFFASKDANVIEKALKNIIEKKSRSLEEKREKWAEKEPDLEPSDRIKKLEPSAAYDEALVIQENYGLSSNKVEWNNEKFLNHLKEVDPQTHRDFLHLKELDSQINGEKKIDKVITDKPLKIEFDSKEQQLDHTKEKQDQRVQPQKVKEKEAQNMATKSQEYSMNAVKKIDAKLKSQDNKNQDRKRTTELSR